MAKNLRIVVTLAASGYIGRVASFLLPSEQLADKLNLFALPDYILLSSLTLVMIPVSFLGVSPIMMAVFFGSQCRVIAWEQRHDACIGCDISLHKVTFFKVLTYRTGFQPVFPLYLNSCFQEGVI